MITQADVLAFLDLTDEFGIVAWLAGGWGCAAARSEPAAPQEDLDLFLEARHAATLTQHLALRGFTADRVEPWHIRFTDTHRRTLDVRLFEHEGGEVTHGPDERWPAAALERYGVLGTRAVRVVGVPG